MAFNFINFTGDFQHLTVTLTNSYNSENTISVDEEKNVNNAVYAGTADTDFLAMSNEGDALFLINEFGQQTVDANIEYYAAGDGGDIIDLSSTTIVLNDVSITGSIGDDILWGNAGNDSIFGGSGNDNLDGGIGDDNLDGGNGDDHIYGGSGDDIISGGDGNNILNGGAGNDTYVINFNSFGSLQTTQTTISDVSDGSTNSIRFDDATTQSDLTFEIIGDNLSITVDNPFYTNVTLLIEDQFDANGPELQTISFADGSNFDLTTIQPQVDPEAQDDVFIIRENETLNGNVLADNGNGADSDANISDILSITPQTFTTALGATVELFANGDFTYTPPAHEFGTDTFTYTLSDGNGGTDTATVTIGIASDGNEYLEGTEGNDTIITTNPGNDTLIGLGGDDIIDGGDGQDQHFGGDGNDIIIGSQGHDNIDGGDGIDTVDYSLNAEGMYIALASGYVNEDSDGSLEDFLISIENVIGSEFDDFILGSNGVDNTISGLGGNDTINGYSGNDTISGGQGDDTIRGQDGDDTITGDEGNDALSGDAGNDIISGGDGNDTLSGENGDDLLNGDAGDDILYGYQDNDTLNGGSGNNQLFGGAGDDIYVLGLGGGTSTVTEDANAGQDSILITDGLTFQDINIWIDGQRNLNIQLADGGQIIVDAYANADGTSNFSERMETLSFDDGSTIDLSGGLSLNDTDDGHIIFGTNFDDAINGNGGDDNITAFTGNNTVSGGDGNDTITAGDGNDNLNGNDGNDNITAGAGDDNVDGGSGNDTLRGGEGNDTINGGIGSDIINGDAGNDDISAGDGNDIIIGATGTNTLDGGAGIDAYMYYDYNIGFNDTITETASADLNVIFFNGDFSFSDLTFTVDNDDLVISVNANDTDYGTIRIENQFAGDGTGIDRIDFRDEESFDLRTITQNEDPNAANDIFNGNEDTVIAGNVLDDNGNGADSDENANDILSVEPATITTASGGVVELFANGDFTYTPAAEFSGTETFSYTLVDGEGGSDTADVTLNIAAVNDNPEAQDDSFDVNENSSVIGNVLADNGNGADSDIEGDSLNVIAQTITTTAGATVELFANGDFTYTPKIGFFGNDSFEYTLTDNNGGTAIGTASFAVAEIPAPAVNLDIRVSHGNTAQKYINSADGYDLAPKEAFGITDVVDGTTLDIGSVSDSAQITYLFTDADTAEVVLDTAWNSVKNIEVSSDTAGDITLSNFVHTDVTFGNGGDSVVNITDAKRGFVATGDGNDEITIDAFTNGSGWSNVFDIESGDGNDTINFTGDKGITQTIIDTGIGEDDVTLGGDYKTSDIKLDEGNDTFIGGDGDDKVRGGNGQDNISGGDGNDHLDGGGHSDFISGGAGDDFVDGGNNGDTLNGDQGDDIITGGNGKDIINGGLDNDTLYGNNGDDTIIGGDGDDIIYGGSNDAPLILDKDFSDDLMFPTLKERTNIKTLNNLEDIGFGVKDPNLNVSYDAQATLTFRKGFAGYKNSLGIYNIAEDGTIESASLLWENVKEAGINTGYTIDIPVGENGGDFGFFIIANGDRRNQGYQELDTSNPDNIKFIYDLGGENERDATIYDDGNDISTVYDDGTTFEVLKGNVYHTTERGGSADINADGKTHSVSGMVEEDNSDVLRIGFEDLKNLGDADFEDVLFEIDIQEIAVDVSEQGNDILYGGDGNDILYGEAGDDILNGGAGQDTLSGGAGSDNYVFDIIDGTYDIISDFELGLDGDTIDITELLDGFDSDVDDLEDFVQLVVSNGDTEIQIDNDGGADNFQTIALVENHTITTDLSQLVADNNILV